MPEKRSNDSQKPTSDSLSLLIKEPKNFFLRRNFVNIDLEVMNKLDLKKGDIIELFGKKKTAGIVKASGRKDRGLGIIRIHSKFRKNIGREVDETVEIRKAEVKLAQKLVLLPYGQDRMSINNMVNNKEIIETIKQTLADNYPITIFDKLYISTSFLFVTIVDKYIIASLIPDDVCIVDEHTDIIFMDDSAEDYYNKSYNLFKKELELDSHDKNIWLSLGNIYKLQKNYEEAEEAYNNVVELDPKNYWAWMALGLIYNQKESYDQALNAFQNVLQYYPVSSGKTTPIPLMFGKHRSLIKNLGFTYKRIGEFDKAIQTFKNIIDKYPKSKNIWNELGKIYFRKREYNEALKMFKMALGIVFDEVYFLVSPLSEMKKILLPNAEQSPEFLLMNKHHQKQFLQDNQYSLYYLAKTFKAIGNLNEALKSCRECLELNPNFEKALKLQSELLVNGNFKSLSTGENKNQVKFCEKCGREIQKTYKFCPFCGSE